MISKTVGIIFRAVKYSESSIIADIYTRDFGLQTYIINGIRNTKSKTGPALLQIMSLVDLVANYRDDRKMHRIQEIRPARVYQRLPFEIMRRSVGLFMMEISRKTIRETEENPVLFDFIFESFDFLDATTDSVANLHLHFMLELSTFLGFVPGGDLDVETPIFDLKEGVFSKQVGHHHYMDESQSSLLYQLLLTDRKQCHLVKMTGPQRRRLLQDLIDFYRLHIDNLPDIHAHEILQEVLE
jgi:DNA repair protein RecO (recombination protein O)